MRSSGRLGGNSGAFELFTLFVFGVVPLAPAVVDVVAAAPCVSPLFDVVGFVVFPVTGKTVDVCDNIEELAPVESRDEGGACDVGVLFMQYLIVASQLLISSVSLASITYSILLSAFSTNVFSWSGISSAVVSRASDIKKQNTPFLGYSWDEIKRKYAPSNKHINHKTHVGVNSILIRKITRHGISSSLLLIRRLVFANYPPFSRLFMMIELPTLI